MRVTVWRSVLKAIAVLAAIGPLWFLIGLCQSFAFATAAPASGPAGVDPARAAREVLQGQDFWWKRIERPTVSYSWLESILRAVLDFFGAFSRKSGTRSARS